MPPHRTEDEVVAPETEVCVSVLEPPLRERWEFGWIVARLLNRVGVDVDVTHD